jgi:NADH dehydrogenase FAD-containing subunit
VLKNAPVRITLLDRLNHHLFQPLLYQVATIAMPDTLICWYHRLIAQKFDGSQHRQSLGRPRVIEEIEQLVVQMAEKNARRSPGPCP